MREGGLVGIWKSPFKNRMTPPPPPPPQLTNFFTWPPLIAVLFLVPPPPHKKINPPSSFHFFYSLLFPYLRLLCSLWRQNLQSLYYRELFGKKKTQIKRKRGQTLLFLVHCSLIKNKQTAETNIRNLHIFFIKTCCFVCYSTYIFKCNHWNLKQLN